MTVARISVAAGLLYMILIKQLSMRKLIFASVLLMSFVMTTVSCKKGSDDDDQECDITVASVAGRYKIIAAVKVVGTTETNVLNTMYDACELDDVNELKADGTFTYSDLGTVCSPSGNESGTWSISGRTLQLNSGFSAIESFNCRDLVVTFVLGGDTYKETYRKQ